MHRTRTSGLDRGQGVALVKGLQGTTTRSARPSLRRRRAAPACAPRRAAAPSRRPSALLERLVNHRTVHGLARGERAARRRLTDLTARQRRRAAIGVSRAGRSPIRCTFKPGAVRRRGDGESACRSRAAHRQLHARMQVATGTVVDGKIVLEGVTLADGARVTVVTRGADEGFMLNETQENALLDSLSQIERGQSVSLEELIASLPTQS